MIAIEGFSIYRYQETEIKIPGAKRLGLKTGNNTMLSAEKNPPKTRVSYASSKNREVGSLYDPSIIRQWVEKLWFNSVLCNSYCEVIADIIQSQDEGFFTIYFRKFPGFDGTVGSCLVALSETSPNSSVPTITPLSPSSANLILVNCHVELIDSRRHLAFKQKKTKKIQPLIPFKPTLEVSGLPI